MNTLTSNELVPLLRELVEQFTAEIRPIVLELAKYRGGREILGAVKDRPATEDVHVEIDRVCEAKFWEKCQEFEARGVRVRIVSEHNPQGYGVEDPNVACDLDPFDGTDQFLKGIWEAWYSVFSFTTPGGRALFGGCLDFIAGILYTADALQKKVTQQFLDDGVTFEVSPSKETELSGNSVVASYKGKWRYLEPWVMMVQDYLSQEQFAGITHYSWGGSFIYALIAAGVVSVYLMPREPTDEIRPARALVGAADLCVYSVTQGGILRLFRWSQKRRVTFFIAAPNRKLAESVVNGIWKGGEEDQDGKGTLAKMRRAASKLFSQPRLRRLFLAHS